MTKIQKNALKARVRKNLKFQKSELKKLSVVGSRYHLKRDRWFKAAFTNIRKEVRLFRRINAKLA
jgi:hypothetical protein